MAFFRTEGVKKGGFLEGLSPQGKLAEIEVDIENAELRSAIAACIAALPDKWKEL